MFNWLIGKASQRLLEKVVFLEPVPIIFRSLQRNLRHAHNAIPLNLGIANESGTFNMYCLGLTEDTTARKPNGEIRLSEEAVKLGVPGWATGTCSLNKDRLFSSTDLARKGAFGALRSMRNRTAYKALITAHAVQVLTIAELMRAHVRGRLHYLQVDAEGRDDDVVLQMLDALPAAELPVVITFEVSLIAVDQTRTLRAMHALGSRNYSMCYGNKNVVAQRKGA